MGNKYSKGYYLQFWAEVREKLLLAAKLDPPMLDKPDLYRKPSRVIFGASFHNYQCDPMSEKDIQSYEKKLDISFPVNFRTYLAICGINSGGPGYGINDRRIANSTTENMKTTCPLLPRKGMGLTLSEYEDGSDLSENEYIFKSDDIYKGTIEITTSGNPCTNHIVITGDAQGDVFSYSGDMLFYEGSFETWYTKWLDLTLNELESGKAKEYFDKTFVPRANEPQSI